MLMTHETAPEALELIEFWHHEAGPGLWFNGPPEFDDRFRQRFLALYERAATGALDWWTATPAGSLALILLLDQFPRNAFRDTPRAYETDAHAHRIATLATAWGQDMLIDRELRLFMYLPFGHSERLADQERAGELVMHLGEQQAKRAGWYTEIIRRFGRFPHRNAILGRESTSDEELFLRNGGFSG